jgi:hypothetical protein
VSYTHLVSYEWDFSTNVLGKELINGRAKARRISTFSGSFMGHHRHSRHIVWEISADACNGDERVELPQLDIEVPQL